MKTKEVDGTMSPPDAGQNWVSGTSRCSSSSVMAALWSPGLEGPSLRERLPGVCLAEMFLCRECCCSVRMEVEARSLLLGGILPFRRMQEPCLDVPEEGESGGHKSQ